MVWQPPFISKTAPQAQVRGVNVVCESPVRRMETTPYVEGPVALSSTILEDVNFTRRAIIVGTNLVAILVSLVIMWVSFEAIQNKPGNTVSFWSHLFTRSVLFTFVSHFEVILIMISVLTLITSSAGFLGALRENTFFLDVYHCGLLFFIGSTTAVAFVLFIFPMALRNSVQSGGYMDFIASYRDSPDLQIFIDNLQKSLRCCGFSSDSFRDWEYNSYFRCAEDNPSRERCAVPATCCRVNDTATTLLNSMCGSGVLLDVEQKAWLRIYTRSCADAALSYVQDHLVSYVMICIGLGLFLVAMILTSTVLQDNIKSLNLIYSAYYEQLRLGQEAMRKAKVSLPPTPPRSQVLGL